MIFFQKMLPEIYAKFRFGSFGFVSVNPTEISVSVVSVFSRFGRPLIKMIVEFFFIFSFFFKVNILKLGSKYQK